MRDRVMAGAIVAAVLLSVTQAVAERPRLLQRFRDARAAPVDGAISRPLPFGGLQRSYRLLDAHRGQDPAPLVVVLHGGGGNGGTMLARWAGQARAAGLIIAAPDGIGRRSDMGTWNAGGCCGEATTQDVDDVGFVGAVIDDVQKHVPVDRRRVYVVGFSNGGMLAHRVAATLGPHVAAAAIVSGAIFGDEPRPVSAVPLLIIHGEKDDVVPFDGGTSGKGFVARAQNRPFLPVRDAVAFWRKANGCDASPVLRQAAGQVIENATGCRSGADVDFHDLPQGRHEWPVAEAANGIDATSVIWTFLKAHQR